MIIATCDWAEREGDHTVIFSGFIENILNGYEAIRDGTYRILFTELCTTTSILPEQHRVRFDKHVRHVQKTRSLVLKEKP